MMLQAHLPYLYAPQSLPAATEELCIPTPDAPSTPYGKVTEIVVQDGDSGDFQLLLPMLERLSREQRWFTWIAPLGHSDKRRLLEAGIDTSKIIVLTPSETHSTFHLACRALRAGTCHAVIRWQGPFPDAAFTALQQAAREGGSQAILVRSR